MSVKQTEKSVKKTATPTTNVNPKSVKNNKPTSQQQQQQQQPQPQQQQQPQEEPIKKLIAPSQNVKPTLKSHAPEAKAAKAATGRPGPTVANTVSARVPPTTAKKETKNVGAPTPAPPSVQKKDPKIENKEQKKEQRQDEDDNDNDNDNDDDDDEEEQEEEELEQEQEQVVEDEEEDEDNEEDEETADEEEPEKKSQKISTKISTKTSVDTSKKTSTEDRVPLNEKKEKVQQEDGEDGKQEGINEVIPPLEFDDTIKVVHLDNGIFADSKPPLSTSSEASVIPCLSVLSEKKVPSAPIVPPIVPIASTPADATPIEPTLAPENPTAAVVKDIVEKVGSDNNNTPSSEVSSSEVSVDITQQTAQASQTSQAATPNGQTADGKDKKTRAVRKRKRVTLAPRKNKAQQSKPKAPKAPKAPKLQSQTGQFTCLLLDPHEPKTSNFLPEQVDLIVSYEPQTLAVESKHERRSESISYQQLHKYNSLVMKDHTLIWRNEKLALYGSVVEDGIECLEYGLQDGTSFFVFVVQGDLGATDEEALVNSQILLDLQKQITIRTKNSMSRTTAKRSRKKLANFIVVASKKRKESTVSSTADEIVMDVEQDKKDAKDEKKGEPSLTEDAQPKKEDDPKRTTRRTRQTKKEPKTKKPISKKKSRGTQVVVQDLILCDSRYLCVAERDMVRRKRSSFRSPF